MSMKRITHIVVHYSATYGDQNLSAADIDKMHKARGWSGIGYHYFIRRDGTVEKGRPDTKVGAHVGGQNSGKLGICWAGGVDRATGPSKGVDNRTPEQTESLVRLIRELLKKHRGAKVVGHRDLAATQCPGFDVPVWWARVQKKKAPDPLPVAEGAPARTRDVIEGDIYIVQRGDTLLAIAKAFDTTVDEIVIANGIRNANLLRPGQKLRIPASIPISPATSAPSAPSSPVVPQPTTHATPEPQVPSHGTKSGWGWLVGLLVVGGAAAALFII
jgi:N-acetylmuramoyl-L-alanine amidase